MAEANESNKKTRKESYEELFEGVKILKKDLKKAATQGDVNQSLDSIEVIMESTKKNPQYEDVYNWVAEILGVVPDVKLHDVTRKVLEELLYQLLNQISSILEEERKKENAGKIRRLFQAMAEHAEEIAEVININEIFS